jgi:hypothetical protein
MKKLSALLLLLVLACYVLHAQKRTFLRIYSLAGNKINQGHFAGTTDSSLLIYKSDTSIEISAQYIGVIKTRRSLGHNVWVGAITGAIPLSILATTSGEPKVNDNTIGGVFHDAVTFTPAEAAIGGFIGGSVIGAASGALVTAFTRHGTFTINGSIDEWKSQRKIMDMLPAGK